MNKKAFSLVEFLNELLPGFNGGELSWDFKVDATPERFTIRIPIKLYGTRKAVVQERVLDTAKKLGFKVSSLYFQSDHDFVLEQSFSDITAEPLAQKR
jgi:hypothetical protein